MARDLEFDDFQPKRTGTWSRFARSAELSLIAVLACGLIFVGLAVAGKRWQLAQPGIMRLAQQPRVAPRQFLPPLATAKFTRPSDPFVVMAPADIDDKMVLLAPKDLDDAMVINPDTRERGFKPATQPGATAPAAPQPLVPRGPVKKKAGRPARAVPGAPR
jgi:hypothetical protein